MGPIQQRFEVDRPIAVVYEAIAQPQALLQKLPKVTGVTQIRPDVYRVVLGPVDDAREVELHVSANRELQRVEARSADGAWSGAIQLESCGPARTLVGVHAERTPAAEGELPHATEAHETLQAFKHALQALPPTSPHGFAGSHLAAFGARRYARDWRPSPPAIARPLEYPFALMRTVSRQMDRVWDQMWRGTPLARLPQMVPGLPWHPDVEVCEQEDQVRVCVDVPGVDESHLHVEIDEGVLTVRGERQDERASEGGLRRSELHYGAFTRRIPLPQGIDKDGARAVLRNGVLEIRIPLHRPHPRRVPVEHVAS